MYREYFITTPLILNKVTFRWGDCRIAIQGNEEKSYIEGPTPQAVHTAFDFSFALRDKARIPGLRIWLRSTSEQVSFPEDPREVKSQDWAEWALSRIPLKSLLGITLSAEDLESVQREIDGYVREGLQQKAGGSA